VLKSDAYIKDRERKLEEVQREIHDISYKYKNHGEVFRQEKERADRNQKMYEELLKPVEDA
jgi:hypothetical protein